MAATLAPHTLAPYVVVVPSRLAAVRRRPMVYVRRRVLVVIADDYIAGEGGRKIVRFISIVMIISMIIIGVYLIWTS